MPNYQSAAKWAVTNLVGRGQTNEKTSPERLACYVDKTLRISNLAFIEGLLQIQYFIDRLDR